MSIPFFEIINRIKKNQALPDNEDLKEYSTFLAPRFMSMNIPNLPGADHLNKYTFLNWSKAQHVALMRSLPWDSSFARYVKGSKDKDKILDELSKVFELAWADTAIKPNEIREAIKMRIIPIEEVERTLVRLGIETKKYNRLLYWYTEDIPF